MTNQKLIRDIDPENGSMTMLVVALVIAVVAGTAVGYFLSAPKSDSAANPGSISTAKVEKSVGIADKKTFPDQAEGMLKDGGIEGEGSFHLERPGGESQNVYLTSTTVDLSPYTGKKVRVWGKTFQGQKAGWLMDVGYVEILK